MGKEYVVTLGVPKGSEFGPLLWNMKYDRVLGLHPNIVHGCLLGGGEIDPAIPGSCLGGQRSEPEELEFSMASYNVKGVLSREF